MRIVKLFLPVAGVLSEVVPLQPGPVCGGYELAIPDANRAALLCPGGQALVSRHPAPGGGSVTKQGKFIGWLTRRHQQMVFPRRARQIATAMARWWHGC